MREIDKKRKHSSGEPSGIGLFAKKPRTSSELTDLEMRVVAGDSLTFLYIKGKGGEDKLYASGYNKYGQLGVGDERNRNKWTEVPFPKGFKIEKVIAGAEYSFLKGKGKDGEDKLYASGWNRYGQLGLCNTTDRNEWTEVPVPQGFTVEKVMAGLYHSWLKGKGKDGEDKLYACGWNYYGQLGLGNTTNRTEWTEVPVPQGFSVEKVIAGRSYTFLKGKGKNGQDKIFSCGANYGGQLGLGDTKDRTEWTEVPVPQGFSVEKVIAGRSHIFLKGKGEYGEDKVYASGTNRYGQLGLGDITDRNEWTEVPVPQGFSVEKVIAGDDHSILKGKGKDGEDKMYAAGYNTYGQLGLGHRWKTRKWTEVPVPQGFSVEKVIAGGFHSFIKGKGKDGEGKLYASGYNTYGQLGLGDTANRDKWTEVPIADLLKKLQEDVNDGKQEDDVSEASGSSGFSMGLNPRDCMF
ncbi:MAG TPA: hypothetical protein QF353_07210 [Gammaproteobacteria bacterium]|nr:hypothetical protein [Gammaproteobacteria bacterium]